MTNKQTRDEQNAALAAALKACTGATEVTVTEEPAQAAAPVEWREAAQEVKPDTDLSWLPEGGYGIHLRAFEATLAPAIRARRRIERAILRRIIADALKAGYTLSVDDGEEITVRKSSNAGEVLAALMTTDEDYLHLHKAGQPKGWVRLVYGNDGWDVVCDYSVDIEAVLAGANALAEKLEGR